jgi:hypothetical protein
VEREKLQALRAARAAALETGAIMVLYQQSGYWHYRPAASVAGYYVTYCDEIVDLRHLAGRVAFCGITCYSRSSSPDLPFFEYHKDSPNDRYYCGCRGWD